MREKWKQFRLWAIIISICMLVLGIVTVIWPRISAVAVAMFWEPFVSEREFMKSCGILSLALWAYFSSMIWYWEFSVCWPECFF